MKSSIRHAKQIHEGLTKPNTSKQQSGCFSDSGISLSPKSLCRKGFKEKSFLIVYSRNAMRLIPSVKSRRSMRAKSSSIALKKATSPSFNLTSSTLSKSSSLGVRVWASPTVVMGYSSPSRFVATATATTAPRSAL